MEVLNAKKKQDQHVYSIQIQAERFHLELLQAQQQHEEELFAMKKKLIQMKMEKLQKEG